MKRIGTYTPAGRLSRYWNAMTGGAAREDVDRFAAEVDPELLSDIAMMRRGHTRHVPDPDFVRRLEGRLVQSTAMSRSSAQPPPAPVHPPTNGRVSDHIWPAPQPARSRPVRRLSGAALATAVFAVLILIGSIVVLFAVYTNEDQTTGGEPTVAPSPTALPGPVVDGVARVLWMSPASGPGAMLHPGFINVAPDGRLWVPSGSTDQIHIYDPDGTFVEAWGGPGKKVGQFDFASGHADLGDVAFASDGTFYVTDAENHRVQKFDANRRFLLSWGDEGDGWDDGNLVEPSSIVILADGSLLVSDYTRGDVQRFDANGTYLGVFANGASVNGSGALESPSTITIAPDGTIWVAESKADRILRFDKQGVFLGAFGSRGAGNGEFMEPIEVAFDGEGHAHVADLWNNRIQVFSLDGIYLAQWGTSGSQPGQFSGAGAIAIDGSDRAFVAEVTGARIQAFQLLPIVVTASPVATASPISG